MAPSVITNTAAITALRNFEKVGRDQQELQETVSTGLKVRDSVDNASSFSIAQGLRGEIRGITSVSQALANAKGVSTVALSGATEFSNLMGDLRKKIIEGMDPAHTAEQQALLQSDYQSILGRMRQVLEQAEYNGQNILIETAVPFNLVVGQVNNLNVIANTNGDTLLLRGQRLDLPWAQLNAQDISTTANATAALNQWQTSMDLVTDALGELGADHRAIDFQDQLLSVVSDAREIGLGSFVDADMARESAKLEAVGVKRQLSAQTLSIANESPQTILGLYRSG